MAFFLRSSLSLVFAIVSRLSLHTRYLPRLPFHSKCHWIEEISPPSAVSTTASSSLLSFFFSLREEFSSPHDCILLLGFLFLFLVFVGFLLFPPLLLSLFLLRLLGLFLLHLSLLLLLLSLLLLLLSLSLLLPFLLDLFFFAISSSTFFFFSSSIFFFISSTFLISTSSSLSSQPLTRVMKCLRTFEVMNEWACGDLLLGTIRCGFGRNHVTLIENETGKLIWRRLGVMAFEVSLSRRTHRYCRCLWSRSVPKLVEAFR